MQCLLKIDCISRYIKGIHPIPALFFSVLNISFMWFATSRHWLDYLVIPLTLINTCWTCLGLIFPSVSSGNAHYAGAWIYLVMSICAVIFNWVQIALLSLQVLSEGKIGKRRIYLLRILDTYIANAIGFGVLFSAVQLLDSGQFFAATPAGIPVNPWELTYKWICLSFLVIGGVGFGPFVASKGGALTVIALANITGWFLQLTAGGLFISAAVTDFRDTQKLLHHQNVD